MISGLIPTKELPKLLAHDLLNEAACRYPSFSIGGSWSWLTNEWGAAMSEAAGHTNNLDNIAQHFHNGEIWGANADILRLGEHGEYQWLLIDQVEKLYRTTVPRFIGCATREYGVELPIKLVAGAVGVKGRRIAYHGGPANGIGRMIKDAVEHEANLNVIEMSCVAVIARTDPNDQENVVFAPGTRWSSRPLRVQATLSPKIEGAVAELA